MSPSVRPMVVDALLRSKCATSVAISETRTSVRECSVRLSGMRRRSCPPAPLPAPCAVTMDPHSGQEASAGAPPGEPGPLVRETTPPPPPPAATAARAAAALVSGFPQSGQNCAPASFCRPQYWQALSAIKLGGPIYCSPLACATCDSSAPRSSSLRPERWEQLAHPRPHPVGHPYPLHASPCTPRSSIPTPPSQFRRRILPSCSAASARVGVMSR